MIELAELLQANRLIKIDDNLYEGESVEAFNDRIYGGALLAQAASATQRSVHPDFHLHSLHLYFINPAKAGIPIHYQVAVRRDGNSFATREVRAHQQGQLILSALMSFHREEPDTTAHQPTMPSVPGPGKLVPDAEILAPFYPDGNYASPFLYHQVDPMNYEMPEAKEPVSYTWLKTSGVLPDDLGIHQQMLAYASDNPLFSAALRPHALPPIWPTLKTASLDHALWFHRPFRADEWLLFVAHGDVVGCGRGVARGFVYNRQGVLVASAMQEGIVRVTA